MATEQGKTVCAWCAATVESPKEAREEGWLQQPWRPGLERPWGGAGPFLCPACQAEAQAQS